MTAPTRRQSADSESTLSRRVLSIADGLPHSVAVVSVPDLRIVYVNQAGMDRIRAAGTASEGKVLGSPPWEVFREWQPCQTEMLHEAYHSAEVQRLHDLCINPEGDPEWFHYVAVPNRDGSTGDVASVSVIAIDVTERRKAEEHLRMSEARYRAVQRQFALLQRALIPEQPQIGEGYSVAAEYISATKGEIGGDFYDVFRTHSGQTGFVIGDVSGKGIRSASLAAISRGAVHALLYEMGNPCTALTSANSMLASYQPDFGSLISAFLGVLDLPSGRMVYASGGHPPPAVYKRNGDVEFLRYGLPPIGLLEDLEYCCHQCTLQPGEKILLYTDGVSEWRHGNEMFGLEGIEESLRRHGRLPAGDLAGAVLDDIRAWSSGMHTDDIAILIIERADT